MSLSSQTKILFILLGRYPTEKAYGVTTKHTLSSLADLGIDTKLYSFPDWILVLLKRIGVPSSLQFRITQVMFAMQVFLRSNLLDFDRKVVWTRHLSIAFLCSFIPRRIFVIEVHQPLTLFSKSLLFLMGSRRVHFFPISEYLRELLSTASRQPGRAVTLLPMAVPQGFLEFPIERNPRPKELEIAFVGRFESVGRTQGVSEFVKLVLTLNGKHVKKLLLIGIGKNGKKSLDPILNQIQSTTCFVEIVEDCLHNEIPRLTAKADLFVIPYPEGDFFASRFPLKAIEYMALRRPILATRTRGNVAIFGEQRAVYYDLGNQSSLVAALEYVLNQETEISRMVKNNFEIAKTQNYHERVLTVLHNLS